MRILLRIAALYWKRWRRAALAYACLFASAGLALVIPRLTGQAIDLVLGKGQESVLLLLAGGIVAIGVARSLITYGQNYLSEYLSQSVSYDLRNKIFNRLQHLSYGFHDRSHTGQLMSRATVDVESIRMFVGFAMLRGVYFVVLMVSITVIIFKMDWQLAVLSLCVLPFITYRTIIVSKRLRWLWWRIQQAIGDAGNIVQENIVGARVVRAFGREKFESEKFRKQAEAIYRQELEANKHQAFNSPLMSFLLLLAMAAVLWYGGRQVVNGVITEGQLTQFLLYVVMLSSPISMLSWMVVLYSRAQSSGQRVFEILDATSPVTEKPGAIDLPEVKGAVRFQNVSFSYDSHTDEADATLKEVSFEAQPGQIIAFVGASGSGKSTIANLIPRFYDVTAGSITIDGVDIREMTLASLRRHVGIIQQDTFLFSATIAENISYGKPGATREEVMEAAKVARLHDFIMGLPEGYDTWVGERGITLSGGQKQRVAIARTILLNPRILITDDSTSSVDTETEYFIRQALAELLLGRTTFIVAQRLRSVQMADLILVLKNGKIVERGTHEELLKQGGIYTDLYNIQFQDQQAFEEGNAPVPVAAESESPVVEKEHAIQMAGEEGEGHSGDHLSRSDEIEFGKTYDAHVVSRLMRYVSPHKKKVIVASIATTVFTLTGVATPFLVGLSINNYITNRNLSGLNWIMVLFVLNGLLNWLSYYVQLIAEARAGQSIVLGLRTQSFDHLQKLSISFFDHNESGRVMSRVQNDVEALGDFLSANVISVGGDVFGLWAILVALIVLDVRLALFTFAVIPLLLMFVVFWQKRVRASFIKVRKSVSLVNGALQESISGVRVIQSLSREDVNSKEFEKVNKANLDAHIHAVLLSGTMQPVVEMLVALATGLVIVAGGRSVLGGTLLVGTLVAFALYIQRFFEPIRMLTMQYGELQRAMASGSRIFELLDIKTEVADAPDAVKAPPLQGEIRFENVSFGYITGREVLHNIDLLVRPGETVALVGPTGAGKSSMVSLIARFYDVTGGRILIDGHDLRRLERSSYISQVGLVLQDPFLFSGTIAENIRYGRLEASRDEIIDAAKIVGAHEFITRMDKGYDSVLEERGQNLSMGQRQLVSFARAVLADPRIFLLDEATANIDSYSEYLLQQALGRLLKGRTAVVIAHRLSTVRNADRIVVLDGGRIVEQGRHEELLAQGGLYARLLEMTFTSFAKERE